MVFGEFDWLTESLMQYQVDVNLLGTMRLTKAFIPLLRGYEGKNE
jgi:NAD(P)-dependent dehydrogenase (short-subunit alcohol dehydrogenase family)